MSNLELQDKISEIKEQVYTMSTLLENMLESQQRRESAGVYLIFQCIVQKLEDLQHQCK